MSAAAQVRNLPDVGVIESAWNRLHERIDQPLSQLEELVSVLFIRPLGEVELDLALQFCAETSARLTVVGIGQASVMVTNVARILTRNALGVAEGLTIASLLDEVRVEVATVVAKQQRRPPTGPSVLVVGVVGETVDELLWAASAQGLAVAHATGADGVVAQSASTVVQKADRSSSIDEPGTEASSDTTNQSFGNESDVDSVVVVLDGEQTNSVQSTLGRLRRLHPAAPILAVLSPSKGQSPDTTVRSRVAATESATTVIDRSLVSPSEVIDELCRSITHCLRSESVSVFGGGADWLAGRLAGRGLAVHAEHNLTSLLATLVTTDLRAVVLTPHQAAMRSRNKARLSVLRLIRTDPSLRSTIVAVIDDRPNAVRRREALRMGADIYVGPDIDLDDLATMVKARLARQGDVDLPAVRMRANTGDASQAEAIFAQVFAEAEDSDQPLAVAVVRSDKLERAVSDVLDRQVASMLREDSVLCRVDKEHLVIGVSGLDADQLSRRMSAMYDELIMEEFSVSIACVDSEPRSLRGAEFGRIMTKAHLLLDQIGAGPSPRVTTAADAEPHAGTCDVFIVDPDPTIGAMLSATLERRGLRVRHETDGLEALNLLSGVGERIRPRVILMDLDLREVDGLQFLRLLFEARVSEHVNVIVLSAQMDEAALRLAFELGIDDFVLKPFSAPLLVHRVMRALAR